MTVAKINATKDPELEKRFAARQGAADSATGFPGSRAKARATR